MRSHVTKFNKLNHLPQLICAKEAKNTSISPTTIFYCIFFSRLGFGLLGLKKLGVSKCEGFIYKFISKSFLEEGELCQKASKQTRI
jgi:hypothetical protein